MEGFIDSKKCIADYNSSKHIQEVFETLYEYLLYLSGETSHHLTIQS